MEGSALQKTRRIGSSERRDNERAKPCVKGLKGMEGAKKRKEGKQTRKGKGAAVDICF
jgi:hypothetical protein